MGELVPVWTTLLAAATGLNMPRTSGLAQQIHFITAGARRQTAAASDPAVGRGGGDMFLVPELAVSLLQRACLSVDNLSRGENGQLGTMLRQHLTTGQVTHAAQERCQLLASYLSLNSLDEVKVEDCPENNWTNPLKVKAMLKKSQTPASLIRTINS